MVRPPGGGNLAIDYEHQTLQRVNVHPEGLAPAAGWIGRLEVGSDGLWAADVEWTERARRLIASGEQRYFSPVIFWTDPEYTDVQSLGPVALTNDPAMAELQPLAAARQVARYTTVVCKPRRLALKSGGRVGIDTSTSTEAVGVIAEAVGTFAQTVGTESFDEGLIQELADTIDQQGWSTLSTFTELGGALAQGQSVRDIAAGLAAPSGATAARRRIGDHPYERRVEEIVAARGCSVFEAIRIVKRHDPELCLEYCERQR